MISNPGIKDSIYAQQGKNTSKAEHAPTRIVLFTFSSFIVSICGFFQFVLTNAFLLNDLF